MFIYIYLPPLASSLSLQSEDLKWILKFTVKHLYVRGREGKRRKTEKGNKTLSGLRLFRNSEPEQPAQGRTVKAAGVSGDPAPLHRQGRARWGWGTADAGVQSQAPESCCSRELQTVHNLSSPIFKCSAERRLLFWMLLSVLSFNRKSIYHLFSRK